MRKVISKAMLLAILLTVILPGTAFADDWFEPSPGYYTLLDEKGGELTVMAREISVDDEYVSGDNKHYIVTRVDRQKREAYTRLEGKSRCRLLQRTMPSPQHSRMTKAVFCSTAPITRNPMFRQTVGKALREKAESRMLPEPLKKI
jgi:hypothetical protein